MLKIIFYLFLFFLFHQFYVSLIFHFIFLLFTIKIFYSNTPLINKLVKSANKRFIKLGLIIPIYNEEKNIPNLIKSIYNNNIYNTQVIFIDDSSIDKSFELLKLYQKKYNFEVIQIEKQKYVSDVLNYGYLHLNNLVTHIGIINGDCVLSPNIFDKIIYRLENYYIDALNLNNKVLKNDKNNYAHYFSSLEKEYKNYVFNYIESSFNNGYFIKKDLVFKVGGWDTITEDLNLNLKIKNKNYTIYHDENIIIYDTLPNNITTLFKQRFRWIFGDLLNRLKFQEKSFFDIILNIYYIFPLYFLINLISINNTYIYYIQVQIIFTEILLYYKSKKYNINYLLESIIYPSYLFIFQLYFYIKLFFKLLFIQDKKITW